VGRERVIDAGLSAETTGNTGSYFGFIRGNAVRKEVFLFLALIVCLVAVLSCMTSASTDDKAQAAAPPNGPAQGISGAVVPQTLTAEASTNPKTTQQQSDPTVTPAQDQDNRQKASVATSVSDPSKKPPAPPQRLRIVVIKN
jgi:hypothetical protein